MDNWGKLDKCFPNLPLMKLSAWHKFKGDQVDWWNPEEEYDLVYKSKVFSFTQDIPDASIKSFKVIGGGFRLLHKTAGWN